MSGLNGNLFGGGADRVPHSQVADLCPRLLQQTVSISRQLAGRRSPTSLQTPRTCRRHNQICLATEHLNYVSLVKLTNVSLNQQQV